MKRLALAWLALAFSLLSGCAGDDGAITGLPAPDVPADAGVAIPIQCNCNPSSARQRDPTRDHERYVACVRDAAEALSADGTITLAERECVESLAGRSACGKLTKAETPDYAACVTR